MRELRRIVAQRTGGLPVVHASQALALVRSYGAGEHPLERRIERLRWFALAYGAAAWLALAAWLVERRPF